MKHLATITLFLASTAGYAQPQLLNSGFETWQNADAATAEPEEWSSVKTSDGGDLINTLAPQLCWPDSNAHTGALCANLRTADTFVGPASGIMTCGRVHATFNPEEGDVYTDANDTQWNQALAGRPDSIVGWYRTAVVGSDHPTLKAALHTGAGRIPENGTLGNWVGGADWNGPSTTVNEWTRFSVPFNYFNNGTPEWALVVVTSGNGLASEVGTEVWYDDLALIYNVTPVPSESVAYVTADLGFALNVDISTGGEPEAATEFVAELSDANGDWSAPMVIGSLTTTTGTGTIPCTIPAGTPGGTGYRIRVTNASPFYAPLEAGIIIDLSTSVASINTPKVSVRSLDDGILVDLSHVAGKAVRCEVFGANGSLLTRGTLLGATQHRLSLPSSAGMCIVRLYGDDLLGTYRVVRW